MSIRIFIILAIFIFIFHTSFMFCQDLTKINAELDSLSVIKSKLESSLDSVKIRINKLEAIKLKIEIENDTTKGVLVALTTDGNVRNKPSVMGDIIKYLPKNAEVLVVGYYSGYYKIKIGNETGYINEMFLPRDQALNKIATYGKSDRRIKIDSHKTTTTKKTYTSKKSSSSYGRKIYTGPRGGKYYINSKGNKVYIKKKKK